ncbi:MAG: permease [Anaerolineales bacterium]|nr:MAG: permease [Anaerolineales bacterium]
MRSPLAPSSGSKKRSSGMLVPTAVMAALAVILLLIGHFRGQGQVSVGVEQAIKIAGETLPLLLLSFLVAGMAQTLLPQELLSRWVGTESGLRGILIGTLAGASTPGGPYVSFPVAAVLLRSGASIGTVVAFVTGWAVWAFSRLPLEVGILGWRFTLVRLASSLLFPFVAGLIAQLASAWMK